MYVAPEITEEGKPVTMNASNVSFIAKVFVLSTLIGMVIKYAAPLLAPAPSLPLCLTLLFAPAVVMAGIFLRPQG